MLVRLYALTWLLDILALGSFYVTGNLTPGASVVFGFLSVGVIFMGLINVLPAAIGDSLRPKGPKPKVVIIGGGFGGLYAAKVLANKEAAVTLIDRKNHHTFQIFLYQVATAILSPGEIATPLRRALSKAKNVEVILGEVTKIDTKSHKVILGDGNKLAFDYLIVAAGARHSYFGHDDWEHEAPGLKTVEDATLIRRRILRAFETAESEAYLTGKQRDLRFAIIGGGPTGVELAGAIADISRLAMAKDFRAIDPKKAKISIYEGSPRVLGMYSERLSAKAKRQLEELGVEVNTNSIVSAVEPGRIKVADIWIPTTVTLWATGVAASPLGLQLSTKTDRAGRVPVKPDLSISRHKNIFIIGDMASLKDVNGVVVPGLASAASQEGKATAKNILRDSRGEKRVPFKYWNKGTLAIIGRNGAVAQIGKVELSGFLAGMMWAVVHIFLLEGARNRYMVFREWIWARYTPERSARLITDAVGQKEVGDIEAARNISL